jgi:hypothetical protein
VTPVTPGHFRDSSQEFSDPTPVTHGECRLFNLFHLSTLCKKTTGVNATGDVTDAVLVDDAAAVRKINGHHSWLRACVCARVCVCVCVCVRLQLLTHGGADAAAAGEAGQAENAAGEAMDTTEDTANGETVLLGVWDRKYFMNKKSSDPYLRFTG